MDEIREMIRLELRVECGFLLPKISIKDYLKIFYPIISIKISSIYFPNVE